MPQRMLNEAQTRAFLNSFGNPFTLTSQNLTKMFSHYRKTGTAYYTDDLLYIGPNDSPFVKEHSLTTVGTYIVNRFIISISDKFSDIFLKTRWLFVDFHV